MFFDIGSQTEKNENVGMREREGGIERILSFCQFLFFVFFYRDLPLGCGSKKKIKKMERQSFCLFVLFLFLSIKMFKKFNPLFGNAGNIFT